MLRVASAIFIEAASGGRALRAVLGAAILTGAQARAGEPTSIERQLEREASLPLISALALRSNPELAAAAHRARALRAAAPAASRLPEPELAYQLWAQPLVAPLSLGRAQMHMLELRQAVPPPGSLGAKGAAALAEADMSAALERARALDVSTSVRRAFAEYHGAHREQHLHAEHLALADRVLDLAEAAYRAGQGTQRDVLRVLVERSRLHNDLAEIERDRATARAALNRLMARPADAPLGPPAPLAPPDARSLSTAASLEHLDRELAARRPEIAAATSAIRARQSEVDAAAASAHVPSFMLGLQYMYMPPEPDPHHYGFMLSMNVPWLSAKYGAELDAARERLAAEQSELAAARDGASFELREAAERVRAAQARLENIERDLLLRVQQSAELVQADYGAGRAAALDVLEASRLSLDVRIERERALVALELALADFDRAAGLPSVADAKARRR